MKHLILVPLQLVAVVMFLCLAGNCTKTEKTIIIDTTPPTPDAIQGSYVVAWEGQAGEAVISGDAIQLINFPCFPVTALREIGGIYQYDLSGRFMAELKAPGGLSRLVLDGFFEHDESFLGNYEVTFHGALCDSGEVQFTKVKPQ